jgi:glutamate dehydrogenase/leucine dehydrogenase
MLQGVMRRTFAEVAGRAESDGKSLREAAFEIGVSRVVDASRTRGYFS